jgi:hypothetical protein
MEQRSSSPKREKRVGAEGRTAREYVPIVAVEHRLNGWLSMGAAGVGQLPVGKCLSARPDPSFLMVLVMLMPGLRKVWGLVKGPLESPKYMRCASFKGSVQINIF